VLTKQQSKASFKISLNHAALHSFFICFPEFRRKQTTPVWKRVKHRQVFRLIAAEISGMCAFPEFSSG